MKERQLISQTNLFPRCEYYTRFVGTTAFAMDEPNYWGTYHRSQSTRHFSESGGREKIMFSSPCVIKPDTTHAFHSHIGGIASPFNHAHYHNAIQLTQLAPVNTENVRDKLLQYRRKMAEKVVQSFEIAAGNNVQAIKKKGRGLGLQTEQRPIVFQDNNFPGVLIMLPILNPIPTTNETTKYWAAHPKPFQKLLLASFVAILNSKAMKAGIPIEIVIRASFGHALPSVCESENTFRINVGIVPKAYAKLMGEALHDLNQMMKQITKKNSPTIHFSKKFLMDVEKYNTEKLMNAIDTHARYHSLQNTKNYKNITQSPEYFEALYKAKQQLDTKDKTGSATFTPVRLKDKNVWDVIRSAGDSQGNSLLSDCFRKNETVDWFVNAIMDALIKDEQKPIEMALSQLLAYVYYDDKATMDYVKIHSDLKRKKREFSDPSFTQLYETDTDFSDITCLLFKALMQERPNERIYEHLERAGSSFFSTYKGSDIVTKEADYGSDSDISEDSTTVLCEDDHFVYTQDYHLSHQKLRVCGGMKAILIAHYGALIHLGDKGAKAYYQDIKQMYYEVEDALKMVHVEKYTHLQQNKIRSNTAILHYDLTHCNASNAADNKTLVEKLTLLKPSVVILDYTSSTHDEMNTALKQCFHLKQVSLVMMVDSGLKNSQAGLDYNPYGEVRVFAQESATTNKIVEAMKLGLTEKDKLTHQAHEMVRASKKRKIAVSVKENFKPSSDFEVKQRHNEDLELDHLGEESPILPAPSRKKIKTVHDFVNPNTLKELHDDLPYNYQCVNTIKGHKGTCHAILPDGKLIIGYGNGTLEMWNKSLDRCLKIFKGHTAYINDVIILSNSIILSASEDGTLKEWNWGTGACVKTYENKNNTVVYHLTSLPNGTIIGATKSMLLVWNQSTGEFIDEREFDSNDINCIAVRPNGNLIIGFSDEIGMHPLEEWDTSSWEYPKLYESHDDYSVSCITLLPNGNLLSARDTTIMEWDSTGKWVRKLEGHDDWVTSLLMLPNGDLLSASQDNTLKVWNLSTGDCIETLKGHMDPITWIATTQKGNLLSISTDTILKRWKPTNNLELKLNEPISRASFLSDEKVSRVTNPAFFKHSNIINQYPKPSTQGDKPYLQDYLIEYLSNDNLESVKKLEQCGVSFKQPNKEGVYPLPVAVHNVNIEALRYLESILSEEEAAKQWQKVDVNNTKKNIKKIQKELKEDSHNDELGKWYILCTKCDRNYQKTLQEIFFQKNLFIENCSKWGIDIKKIRNDLAEEFEDIDPVGHVDIYGSVQILMVHKHVIKKICMQLDEFKEEINSKFCKSKKINPEPGIKNQI